MNLLQKFISLVLYFTAVNCLEITEIANHEYPEIYEDYILCRGCGCDISTTKYLISKRSPEAVNAFNDTLFGKDKVLVQVLTNQMFMRHAVITVSHSDCTSVGQWEADESWFPGFRQTVCMCPECGAFLGFYFEPIDPDLSGSRPFTALILPHLVGESFLQSLTKYPSFISSN